MRIHVMYRKVRPLMNLDKALMVVSILFIALYVLDRTMNTSHNRTNHSGRSFSSGYRSAISSKGRIMNRVWLRTPHLASSKNEKQPMQDEYAQALMEFEQHRDQYEMSSVNCKAIFNQDINATQCAYKVRSELNRNRKLVELNDEFYIQHTKNCSTFIESRGYITSSLSDEEADFPLAYSIIVYKTVEMLERLLRAIYRPQNVYCIHVDIRVKASYFEAVKAIASCFPNVYIGPKRIAVSRNNFSMVESELVCMEFLRRFDWKYLINLTGQEFPLKTNAELVKILKIYNGTNDILGTIKYAIRRRWRNLKPPPGIRLTKGQVHVVASQAFIDFMFDNKDSQILLNYTKLTVVPDETFFSTLNNNPQLGTPGAYTGQLDTLEYLKDSQLARYKNWNKIYPCAGGRMIHHICIITTGDLPVLKTRPELFANKFFLEDDRVVIGCLEEWHFNKTLEDYTGNRYLNKTFYENVEFVKHHQ